MRHLVRGYLLNRVAASPLWPGRVRRTLYGWAGVKAETINLRGGCSFSGNRVSFGRSSFINEGCHFDCERASITLGAEVFVGPRATFVTATHEIGPATRRAGALADRPVVIEDGCWIGASATILPGVTVGRGCLVAAGAVVTKDCEPNGLYAGVPARRVRELEVGQEGF